MLLGSHWWVWSAVPEPGADLDQLFHDIAHAVVPIGHDPAELALEQGTGEAGIDRTDCRGGIVGRRDADDFGVRPAKLAACLHHLPS